jgi:hypothetical protein
VFSSYFIHFAKTKPNVYQILEMDRYTSTSNIKRKFRDASLKYHPDKNKSPDAKEIFYSLNDNVEMLKDPEKRTMYDYYNVEDFKEIERPTAQGMTDAEYEFAKYIQKLSFFWGIIPFYIAWFFIPLGCLDVKRRVTKLVISGLLVGLAFLEFQFMSQSLGEEYAAFIRIIVPAKMTFKDFFHLIHIGLPYLITLITAFFDIYYLKTFDEKPTDDELFKTNIKAQNKLCRTIISHQTTLIEYLGGVDSYTLKAGKKITELNAKIFKSVKKISTVEMSNEVMSKKWTFGSFVSLIFFIVVIVNAFKAS